MIRRITKYTVLVSVVGFLLWGLTHYKEAGVVVTRPSGQEGEQQPPRVVVVEVAADDSISVNETDYDPDGLEEFLRTIADEDGRPPQVVLSMDPDSSDQALIIVLDVVQKSGAESAVVSP